MNESEKIKFFTDTVLNEANEKADRIKEKYSIQKDAEIHSELSAVLSEAHDYIYKSISKTRSDNAATLSAHKTENRNEYLQLRERLISDVGNRVSELVSEFVNSEKYSSYFIKTLGNTLNKFSGKFTLICKGGDTAAAAAFENNNNRITNIEYTDSISLGGFILRSSDNTKLINMTLDDKIKKELKSFRQTLALYLTSEANNG